ncbi:MAG TPA: sulfatase/phosphatase domain-containing protein, partial [Acidobacteriota bacterium]|nr:sulfatase/phosphatase domain-containing protein [Acidobacteriota bacterium]
TRWKLIRHHYSRMMDELYDLENDSQERQNLYRNPDFQEIRNRLQEELSAWQRSVDDPLLKGLPPIE